MEKGKASAGKEEDERIFRDELDPVLAEKDIT